MSYSTIPLNKSFNRNDFCCGKPLLDNYFYTQVTQDIKKKLSVCFILPDNYNTGIKGYYTFSTNSISNDLIPLGFKKHLPKSYTQIPTILLGRLAIDKRFQKKGIGKLLLIDAMKRSYDISKLVGAYALIVDPIDKDAKEYYSQFDFVSLPDSGKMFLPMKTIKILMESIGIV